jgi:hypothetical protein
MHICEANCFLSIRKNSRRSNKFFGRNKVKASKLAVCAFGIFLVAAARPAIGTTPGTPAPSPAGSAQQQVTHNFDRSIPLPSGQSLRIEHKLGDITVRTHASRDIHVSAAIHVSASSQQDAETFANQIQIHIESSPSGVLIRTDYPEQNDSWWGHNHPSSSVEYTIDMPADAPLTIRNKFGKVSVAGLKAATDVDAENGSISVHDGRGTQMLRASFGAIELIGNDGDADLAVTNGNVTVSDVRGALTLRDKFGAVSVANIERTATITNGNGSVRLHRAAGATVTNSFGAVEVGDITGDLTVRNQNGTVDVTNITGSADLGASFEHVTFLNIKQKLLCRSQNGNVSGSGVGGSATIRASFGNVDVHDIGGPLEVVNQNGKIIARDIRGGVNLKTSFSPVEAIDIQHQRPGSSF